MYAYFLIDQILQLLWKISLKKIFFNVFNYGQKNLEIKKLYALTIVPLRIKFFKLIFGSGLLICAFLWSVQIQQVLHISSVNSTSF